MIGDALTLQPRPRVQERIGACAVAYVVVDAVAAAALQVGQRDQDLPMARRHRVGCAQGLSRRHDIHALHALDLDVEVGVGTGVLNHNNQAAPVFGQRVDSGVLDVLLLRLTQLQTQLDHCVGEEECVVHFLLHEELLRAVND